MLRKGMSKGRSLDIILSVTFDVGRANIRAMKSSLMGLVWKLERAWSADLLGLESARDWAAAVETDVLWIQRCAVYGLVRR
jgi:hypothetical protein